MEIMKMSLSARRAWIEITAPCPRYKQVWVALRKESVDRNKAAHSRQPQKVCRSPQGERG